MLIQTELLWGPLELTLIILPIILLYALCISFIFACLCKFFYQEIPLTYVLYTYFSYSVPISILGYATGMLTGLSPISTTATVLPASLAFIGSLSIYLFGTDSK
jgi:hypothetical protein